MASYTENLELLMKDPVADGADTFNIETMLNENWEKIDEAVSKKADVGEDGKIPAEQLPEMKYDPAGAAEAVREQLNAHAGDRQNPHGVTASQVGAFTKGETLTPETAALYGEGVAVPDDVFALLSTIIPSGYGVLKVVTTDENGSPVSVPMTVSPAIDGKSQIVTDSQGVWSAQAPVGTYRFSFGTSIFVSANPSSFSLAVQSQKITPAKEVKVNRKLQGYAKITSSQTVIFPDFIETADFWGIGGGGSGGCSLFSSASSGTSINGCGGGSGYTAQKNSVSVKSKTFSVSIGAGGEEASVVANDDDNADGLSGGATTIKDSSGGSILTANGGNGGRSASRYNGTSIDGADGGSGSGAADGYDSTSFGCGEPGTNGSNGGDTKEAKGGTGQGTTTYPFASSAYGTNYGVAGGSAVMMEARIIFKSAKTGNGETSNNEYKEVRAGNGEGNTGNGGGGMAAYETEISDDATYQYYSGAGGSGCVFIRWPTGYTGV